MAQAHALEIRRNRHRRTVRGRVPGFPEFSNIGYGLFTRVGRLSRHEHPGAFEFCLIMRGHVTWWARERIYELRGGDVYATWPDEPHGGLHELMHPCAIYWITVKVPRPKHKAARHFLRLPPKEARALCAAIHALPGRHLRGAGKLEPYYQALFQHLGSGTLLGITQARAAMQGLLAQLAALPAAPAASGFVPPGITRARELLDGCPRPWPSVRDLAEVSGMSVSHFHACFLREVGLAPMEYAHRVRLDRARRILREPGATVTAAAERLGYCSSQHLGGCFRRYLGMTPTQARAGRSP